MDTQNIYEQTRRELEKDGNFDWNLFWNLDEKTRFIYTINADFQEVLKQQARQNTWQQNIIDYIYLAENKNNMFSIVLNGYLVFIGTLAECNIFTKGICAAIIPRDEKQN